MLQVRAQASLCIDSRRYIRVEIDYTFHYPKFSGLYSVSDGGTVPGPLNDINHANSVDDVEHMIFECVAMVAERQKHQSLFARGRVALVDYFIQDPNRIGCFCARLLQGLQRVISDSVLSIHGCLVCRPVVGHLNRPEMASNRLCNTSVIILCYYTICHQTELHFTYFERGIQ